MAQANGSEDIASFEARMSLSRAALADKIFANLAGGSSSSSAASSPSSNAAKSKKSRDSSGIHAAPGSSSTSPAAGSFQHRPPTLGLGAQPASKEQAQVGRLSVEDARLRGRLTKGKGPDQGHDSAMNGKRKATDDAETDGGDDSEEEEAKGSSASKKTKAGAAQARSDPFATKAQNKKKQASLSQGNVGETKQSGGAIGTTSTAANGSNKAGDQDHSQSEFARGAEGTTAPIATSPQPPQGKLSKSQRKKLNKKRRQEATEEEPAAGDQSQTIPTPNGEGKSADAAQDDSMEVAATPIDGPSSSSSLAGSAAYRPSAQLPSATDLNSTSASSSSSAHQSQLRAKLQGSHFRQLNESLYTSHSSDSFQRAQEDPMRMQSYHDGFREQVKKWPAKPYEMIGDWIVQGILEDWTRVTKSKGSGQAPKPPKSLLALNPSASAPLGCLVADLGAGEGVLTRYLHGHTRLAQAGLPASLCPRVLAYDLLDTADGSVRGADCAAIGGVPLPGRSDANATTTTATGIVDVAVFCLSLMGVDWPGMVREARRILRNPSRSNSSGGNGGQQGGHMVIAEVSSRMGRGLDAFAGFIERMGFKEVARDQGNTHFVVMVFRVAERAGSGEDEELDGEDAAEILQPCLYKRR